MNEESIKSVFPQQENKDGWNYEFVKINDTENILLKGLKEVFETFFCFVSTA